MTATSTSKPGPLKRLVELLQDQQEPFTLDVFISERRYMKKNINISESRNYDPNLTGSAKSSTKACNSNVKRVVDTLKSYKNRRKVSGYNNGKAQKGGGERVSKKAKKHQHNAETNQLSSSKSGPKGNVQGRNYTSQQNHGSSSQSTLKLHNLRELEAASYTKLQLGFMEDGKQLSPVSVLQPPSDECSPIEKNSQSGKVTDDSIFSAYLSELYIQSLNQKQNDIESVSSQYLKAKRVFMQTKQLVFDCVQEAVDKHGRSRGRQKSDNKEVLGPVELGKIICEQIYSWGKQCGDVTKTSQAMNLDFSNTMEEWRDFSPIIGDIGIEIGDAILDDIVTEMIYF